MIYQMTDFFTCIFEYIGIMVLLISLIGFLVGIVLYIFRPRIFHRIFFGDR